MTKAIVAFRSFYGKRQTNWGLKHELGVERSVRSPTQLNRSRVAKWSSEFLHHVTCLANQSRSPIHWKCNWKCRWKYYCKATKIFLILFVSGGAVGWCTALQAVGSIPDVVITIFHRHNNNNNNIYLTAIGLSPGGSGFKHIYKYLTLCYWNLHLYRVGATWEACSDILDILEPPQHLLSRHRETKKEKPVSRWSVAGPSEHWHLASGPLSKVRPH